ncbi:MAG: hypothetical protein DLM71_05625 [Chloroflexi bacterium]|nr:MAG: hypothetical protein DLM71_05625 [Chloroflexota bacterium]
MPRIEELDEIVGRFDLNQHPFYQDWRAGSLPIEQLRDYATEWAPVIATLADGWEAVGEPAYAEEEREHDALWTRFRDSLGRGGEAHHAQSAILLEAARHLFRARPEALGALYAFEVQQPATAQSKLAGLREHYGAAVDEAGREYFAVHAVETDEPAMLAAQLEQLSAGEFARARTACAIFSAAAWGALDGIYYR